MTADKRYDFNFLVDLGDAQNSGGFAEVLGLDAEIPPERGQSARKSASADQARHVSMKRGVIDAAHLRGWFHGNAAMRNVIVRSGTRSWKLTGARIVKYAGPPLAARGNDDVAIEELTLSCERIDTE